MNEDNNATMEVPIEQRNLQQRSNQLAATTNTSFDINMDDDEEDNNQDEEVMMISQRTGDDGGERRDTSEERDQGPQEEESSSWFHSIPMPSFWYASQAALVEDCREEEEDMMELIEREGGNDEEGDFRSNAGRTHEPLKRQHDEDQEDGVRQSQQASSSPNNKRRRLSFIISDTMSMAIYHGIAAQTERQQVMGEYMNPISLSVFFVGCGLTPFAIKWGLCIFVGHFIQMLFSTFGPETKSFRLKQAWITPLPHALMDAYLWNNPLFTALLLRGQEWFGNETRAYWLGTILSVLSGHGMVQSLKNHYMKCQHKISDSNYNYNKDQIELHFVDGLLLHGLAVVAFILARLSGIDLLLYFGLVVLNLIPIYTIGSYKKRLDKAINTRTTTTTTTTRRPPPAGETKGAQTKKQQ